jgi:hypothetical protein
MDINLSNLSLLSQRIEKERVFKRIYSKPPADYMGLNKTKPLIDSFCHLNKDGTETDNVIHRNREIMLFNKFLEKLSRSNKQIEKERKNYLSRLNHFNCEKEEDIKLRKIKKFESVAFYRKLNNLLQLRHYKNRFDNQRKEIQIQSEYEHIDDSNNNYRLKTIKIKFNKSDINRLTGLNNSMNNKDSINDKTRNIKLDSSSKASERKINYSPFMLNNFNLNSTRCQKLEILSVLLQK